MPSVTKKGGEAQPQMEGLLLGLLLSFRWFVTITFSIQLQVQILLL